MVRLRKLSPRTRANVLVLLGSVLLAIAAGLVYLPAGLAAAGAAAILSGLYLVDVEGARESRTARPIRPPH
jgi:hypothetical protein